MRNHSVLFIIAALAFTSISSAHDKNSVILKDGIVVDVGKERLEKRDLFICHGIIVEQLGKDCHPKIIDVSGKWLIPGLNDMHVHARGQLLGDDRWKDFTPRQVAKIFIQAGVVRFLDAMQDEQIIFKARLRQQEKPEAKEADILAAGGAFTPTDGHGFEYLKHGVKPTALHVVDTPHQALNEVNSIALKNPDVLKIMYDHRGVDDYGNTIPIKDGEMGTLGRAMKKDVMEAIVKRGNELGLKPYMHLGVWQNVKDAILAGARIINHLAEGPIPEDVLNTIKEHKIYWIPTLVAQQDFINIKDDQNLLLDKLLNRVASPEVINSYKLNEFFNGKLYKTDDMYYTVRHQLRHRHSDPYNIKKLIASGVTLITGSDIPERGSFIGWSTHREMALLVANGLSPWQALAAATINAGALFGLNYGLEKGTEGNVVVLDRSPIADIWNTTKISQVIHRGELVEILRNNMLN